MNTINLGGKAFTADDINPDAMTREQLIDLWNMTNTGRARLGKFLFPDRPKGYVRAARDIGLYAMNKATAMKLRKEGDIPEAQKYEAICDDIYRALPGFARW